MRLLGISLAALLIAVLLAMLWQHLRYLGVRRAIVEDRQPLFYPSATFHVMTMLRVAPGADVIDAVRAFKRDTEGLEGARWVYAGKVVLNALVSRQIGAVEWSAVALVQYPSQDAYRKAAGTERYRQALAGFAQTYSHGLERPMGMNLAVHQIFLARRVRQIAAREPSHFPFEPMPEGESVRDLSLIQRLLASDELDARAAVVVNLIQRGTREQRAADRAYTQSMMGAMAEGGYGPMHMGRAVAVEGEHAFDNVAVVYYPGVAFFADMARSRFFQGIIGDKQLGDSLSSITVPILSRL